MLPSGLEGGARGKGCKRRQGDGWASASIVQEVSEVCFEEWDALVEELLREA